MSKVIFTGLEDSGKSLKLASTAMELVFQNSKWAKITGVPRPIVSNLEFSQRFVDWAQDDHGIPIRYWKDIEELPAMTDCDLICDEIGTYFDSRTFKDLPLDVRLWLAQASKLGVDMYGSAQDFAQVDISFRRLTTHLFQITKIIGSARPTKTRPPVNKVWGVCMMRQLDPVAYDEQSKKFANDGLPSFFFIQKKICEIFDTTKRIPKSKPVPFKHIARTCTEPHCQFHMFEVINGVKHKITHL